MEQNAECALINVIYTCKEWHICPSEAGLGGLDLRWNKNLRVLVNLAGIVQTLSRDKGTLVKDLPWLVPVSALF